MSEKWWFVMPFGLFRLPVVLDNHQVAVDYSLRRGGGAVVHARIVEDAEPCEWEAERWDVYRITGENKTLCLGMKFCPMCGRSLAVDE